MSSNIYNKNRNRIRTIVLVIIGVVAFVVSITMNIIGMRNALNKERDLSGMAGFSTRKNDSSSLSNSNNKASKDKKNEEIEEKDILINALPLVNLNNNLWDRVKAGFAGFEVNEAGNAIFDDGYIMYCNGKYVNSIVFDLTYEKEVMGHIRVGTDLKTIEKKLGTPTFKTKYYLGYKTREVYVFFHKDEIAVYSNRKMSNENLEELLASYTNNIDNISRSRFLANLRKDYEDFIIELDEEKDEVTAVSLARKVVIKLDSLGTIETEVYNGYDKVDDNNDNILYKTNKEDLIEIVENERIRGK